MGHCIRLVGRTGRLHCRWRDVDSSTTCTDVGACVCLAVDLFVSLPFRIGIELTVKLCLLLDRSAHDITRRRQPRRSRRIHLCRAGCSSHSDRLLFLSRGESLLRLLAQTWLTVDPDYRPDIYRTRRAVRHGDPGSQIQVDLDQYRGTRSQVQGDHHPRRLAVEGC